MFTRLTKRQSILIGLAAVFVAYLLFGWLALPPLLRSQAEKFVAEKTGHRLTMDAPEFNPFTLALRLHNLKLVRADGEPLLAFKELLVDISAESLFRWAYVFDAIRLDGLETTVAELPGEQLNWSAFTDALAKPEATAAGEEPTAATSTAGLPRLIVHELAIVDGRLDVADRHRQPELSTRIEPLDLELSDLSTLANDKGPYELSARTGFGAHIQWQGELGINPLSLVGNFSIDEIALAKLPAALLQTVPGLASAEGAAAVSAHYLLSQSDGQVQVTLDQAKATLDGLKLRLTDASEPFLALERIEAKDGRLDLRQRSIAIGALLVSGGSVQAVRRADGSVDLMRLATAAPASANPTASNAAAPAPAAASGWHYRIDHVGVDKIAAALHDQTVTPAAELALQDIAVGVDAISDNLAQAWPAHLEFKAAAGGNFSAEGKVVAGEPSADFQVKLTDLSLKPAQPYLQTVALLKIADGRLSADGRVQYDPKTSGFRGGFALHRLRLTEGDAGQTFLALDSLASHSLDASPTRVMMRELTLDGLDTTLIIAKDKTVNLTRILRKQPAAAAVATAPATPAADAAAAPMFPISIERLRISDSGLEFADLSLALPFGTHVHHLGGSINGISTRAVAPAQVELDGQVDDFGMARAIGQINLFKPTEFTDLKVAFRNVEMTRLTPYSATFAGRKIDSGKLSLDLEYKINKRQLSGENRMIVDQLTLGDHVDSPEAKNLPLDLAIALLRDADGRIDLGLPVSGSLDDPQFSYGQLIWKVISNVITKIALAPFRALANLFGGDQKLDSIVFEAGQAQPTAPEREKLAKLAQALNKRPALALTLAGTWSEADRAAMQDIAMRQALAVKLGLSAEGDPGPMSTAQPEVRQALETLFAERLGKAELATLKEGFRNANPGQLQESATGKMMSRLTGAFQKKRELDEKELGQLKGADFHGLLYQRLAATETVTDETLQALANARGAVAMAILSAAGAPAERTIVGTPGKMPGDGNEIALKLDLKAAAPAAAAGK